MAALVPSLAGAPAPHSFKSFPEKVQKRSSVVKEHPEAPGREGPPAEPLLTGNPEPWSGALTQAGT